jgi:hypothetical protein
VVCAAKIFDKDKVKMKNRKTSLWGSRSPRIFFMAFFVMLTVPSLFAQQGKKPKNYYFSGPEFEIDYGAFWELGHIDAFPAIPFLSDSAISGINNPAYGFGLQIGVGFEVFMPIDILAELGINLNYPGIFGLHAGISAEMYPFTALGFVVGGGIKHPLLLRDDVLIDPATGVVPDNAEKNYFYLRFGILFGDNDSGNRTVFFDWLPGRGIYFGFAAY